MTCEVIFENIFSDISLDFCSVTVNDRIRHGLFPNTNIRKCYRIVSPKFKQEQVVNSLRRNFWRGIT